MPHAGCVAVNIHPGVAGGSTPAAGLALGRQDGIKRVEGVCLRATSNLPKRRRREEEEEEDEGEKRGRG